MASEQSGFGSQQDQRWDNTEARVDVAADAIGVAAPLKTKVVDAINEQKAGGADKLTSLAGAVTNAAAGFDDQLPQVAQYIRDAGHWMEQSASDVRDQNFEELLTNVGNFAKNRPALAFGVAALSGFALSRFLKSERPRSEVSPTNQAAE